MQSQQLDIQAIQQILPQRYPFLMIDKVIEASPEKVVAIKNTSINEEYFQGHFPGNAVMPAVLIVEAMAQAGIILYRKIFNNNKTVYLGAVKARFFDSVFPGSQLRIEVKPVKMVSNAGIISGEVFIGSVKVAQAEVSFSAKGVASS